MLSNVIDDIRGFVEQPFKEPLNLTHLFLIVGVVLVMVVMWNLILFHIRIAAEELV